MGPCLGSFFEVFCINVAEGACFGFNEALWLMATGRATVEAELQTALIAMIPIPEPHDAGGLLVRDLLAEFLQGFSLRTLIFLLDMTSGT